ncbi:PaxU protein [Seiridium cupressi]
MSSTEKTQGFPGFTKLSNTVYLRPAVTSDATASNPTYPTTILMYAWGDALPKHLNKYVLGYLLLYPNAQIVMVLGPMVKMFWQSLEQRSSNMEIAIRALAGADERVLVHAMSNTGGVNYAATLHAYRRLNPGKTLPHILCVFDSTPGSTSVRTNLGPWSRAMAIGAASWFPGPMAVPRFLAVLFLLAIHSIAYIRGIPSAAVFSTKAINDPEFESSKARRTYLYGTHDDIIQWEALEQHAAQAKEKGFQTDLERFEGTSHVGHMKADPERYWGAIKDSWVEAIRGS